MKPGRVVLSDRSDQALLSRVKPRSKGSRSRPPVHLPPLSSPQSGPLHISSVHRTSHSVTCTPQEEDTVYRSRLFDGYQLRLTPKCLDE
jgi:hypothetical protein